MKPGETFTDSRGNTFLIGPDNKLTPISNDAAKKPSGGASPAGAVAGVGLPVLANHFLNGGSAAAGTTAAGASAASQAAWNAGADAATSGASAGSQAAWNAGADAATASECGTAMFNIGGPSTAGYIGAAISAGQGVNNYLKGDYKTPEQQRREAEAAAAMTVANYYTAGLASLADGVSGGRVSKGLGKLSDVNQKVEDTLSFGLSSKIKDKIFHQSTIGKQMSNTGQLLEQGKDDKAYLDYVNAVRGGVTKDRVLGDKPFAGGKYATWDEYKAAGLDPKDLSGVYGNIQTYGPEWAHLTEDQRQAVTKANIDANLYTTNKGDVEITDLAKALANKDQVLKNYKAPPPGATSPGQGNTPQSNFNDPLITKPLITNLNQKANQKATEAANKASRASRINQIIAPTTQAPRYDISLSNLVSNPYL